MKRGVSNCAPRLQEIVRDLPDSKKLWMTLANELTAAYAIGPVKVNEIELLQMWHCIDKTRYGFDLAKYIAMETYIRSPKFEAKAVVPLQSCVRIRLSSRTLIERFIKTLLLPATVSQLSFGASVKTIGNLGMLGMPFHEYGTIPILINRAISLYECSKNNHVALLNYVIRILPHFSNFSVYSEVLFSLLYNKLKYQDTGLIDSKALLTTLLSQANTRNSCSIVSLLVLRHRDPIPLLCFLKEAEVTKCLTRIGTAIQHKIYHKLLRLFVLSPGVSSDNLLVVMYSLRKADPENALFVEEIFTILLHNTSFVEDATATWKSALFVFSCFSRWIGSEAWFCELSKFMKKEQRYNDLPTSDDIVSLIRIVPKTFFDSVEGNNLLTRASIMSLQDRTDSGLNILEILRLQSKYSCRDPHLVHAVLKRVLDFKLIPKMSLKHIIELTHCISGPLLINDQSTAGGLQSEMFFDSIRRRISTKNVKFGGINLSHLGSPQLVNLIYYFHMVDVAVPIELYNTFIIRLKISKSSLETKSTDDDHKAFNSLISLSTLLKLVDQCSLPRWTMCEITSFLCSILQSSYETNSNNSYMSDYESFSIFCDILKIIVTKWQSDIDMSHVSLSLLQFLSKRHVYFNHCIPGSLLVVCIVLDDLIGTVRMRGLFSIKALLQDAAYLQIRRKSTDLPKLLISKTETVHHSVLTSLNNCLKKNGISGKSHSFRLLENVGGIDNFSLNRFTLSDLTCSYELVFYLNNYLEIDLTKSLILCDSFDDTDVRFHGGITASQINLNNELAADIADAVLKSNSQCYIREFTEVLMAI